MTKRRSAAPDIAACILFLYGFTLVFALMRSAFSHTLVQALQGLALYGGLLATCASLGFALLGRRTPGLLGALLFFAVVVIAAVTGFFIPETGRLPTGMLSLFGVALLLPARHEFA